MCADFNIHDTGGGNPHAHILLTMRPLNERGTWVAKSKKEYELDENGERIRLPSGRYKSRKIDLVDWNSQENAEVWRAAWADLANEFLERNNSPERIDHRSYERQGIDQIPTVHVGVSASQMEKKGIATERGELNRNIQKGEPPYPRNPGADRQAQRLACRTACGARKPPRRSRRNPRPCKSTDEVFERAERKEPEVFAELAATPRRRRIENHSTSRQLPCR